LLSESVGVSAQESEVNTNRRSIESKYDAVGRGFPVDVKNFIILSSLIVKPELETKEGLGLFRNLRNDWKEELFC
jgi:hypothetical protein